MPQSTSNEQDRDQQVLSRLARIEHKVDSLEQTTAFALRAEAEKHFESVKEIFGKSKRRAQVYLAVNGERSVQDLADFLGIHRPHVTADLQRLREEGLLEVTDTIGGRDIWSKKPVDRTLRISRFLCEEFSLDKNGNVVKVPSKKGAKKSNRR
jgi:hypothetical protein